MDEMQTFGLQVIEHAGQRVLTTQQLAEKYETDSRIISNNFNRNSDRYKEGEHYFVLTGEAKRAFCDHHQFDDGSKKAVAIYLWTEKGCLLHAKSLNTDKAWEVYSILVDTYFRAKEASSMTELEVLAKVVNGMVLQERRLAEQQKQLIVLQHRVNNLDAVNATGDRRQLLNKMVQRLAHDRGITFAQAWKHFDEAFNFAYRANLTARRNNYAEAHNMREIARPDYLERVGLLEDAIRVMDKLLNGTGRQLA